jgi:excisionase family DNA binding protein
MVCAANQKHPPGRLIDDLTFRRLEKALKALPPDRLEAAMGFLNQDEFIRADEIADHFRISAETVRRWCRTGKLTAVRIGRRWMIQRNIFEHLTKHGLEYSK